MHWARWVLRRTVATLARWAYTDGTTFYLARITAERESATRAALGTHVWRQASGTDGLYEDCIGPSAYWKAQGTTVFVWGLLAGGMLFITVLPERQTMNRWWYEWIVRMKFPVWLARAFGRGRGAVLLQDHDKGAVDTGAARGHDSAGSAPA